MNEEHKQIYEGISEINRAVGRIEGKLEGVSDRLDLQLEDSQRIETRVGSIEGWRKWMTGAQAVIAFILAWMFK
jgi:hypothetical protein